MRGRKTFQGGRRQAGLEAETFAVSFCRRAKTNPFCEGPENAGSACLRRRMVERKFGAARRGRTGRRQPRARRGGDFFPKGHSAFRLEELL